VLAQGVLGFNYQSTEKKSGLTSLAGLPLYLEFAHVSGLIQAIRTHLTARDGTQGWTDAQVVMALIFLNLAGGESVSDLKVLEEDDGFARVLQKTVFHGLSRPQRRELERRWRKEKHRSVPSPSAVFRYLSLFHNLAQGTLRISGKALIPAPNQNLQALGLVNQAFLAFVQSRERQDIATLDVDATLVETHKSTALFGYKGFKSYQPLNVWWAEQELVAFSEFRDGNVPAGYQMLRVFQAALDALPEGVETVRLRSDTAGYQHEVLQYCAQGSHPRFKLIEFAIGCDVSKEFKAAVAEVREKDWHDLKPRENDTRAPNSRPLRQWAEVAFVPAGMGFSKKTTPYRYIATRELLQDQPLPGMEGQQKLPFQTMGWAGQQYKVFGIVTNFRRPQDEIDKEIDRVRRKPEGRQPECWSGHQVIHWIYERSGKSESAHAAMKEDLAGGRLPSGDFGENAAWWGIMILAFNLNAAMKRLVLGGSWITRRLKAIRFHLIHIAGFISHGGNTLWINVSRGIDEIVRARERMRDLSRSPAA